MPEQSLSHKFAHHPAYSLQETEAGQDSPKQQLGVDPLHDLISDSIKHQVSSTSFSWQDITKALGGNDAFVRQTNKETQDTAEFDLTLAAEQAHSLEAAQTLPSNNMHLYGDSLLKHWLSTDLNTKEYWPPSLYSDKCYRNRAIFPNGTECDVLEAPDNTRHEITKYSDDSRTEVVKDRFGRPIYQSNMQGGQWQIHVLSYNDLADKPSPFLSSKRTITSEGNITNIIYGKQGTVASVGSDNEDFIA